MLVTVGDCTGSMEKNLWVGNEDTKFENQNNWTVKVPGDGEDVVFATESNNANPKNAAQKGAAKNDCVLPEAQGADHRNTGKPVGKGARDIEEE